MKKRVLQSLLFFALLLVSISAVPFKGKLLTYTQQSIEPDVTYWPQPPGSNWCGPATLQAAIDWVWWYNRGYHVMKSQQYLWDFMKNNTCYDIYYKGRDAALLGTVGDDPQDIRRMNIAYDFGVDPHAVAWTMWKNTPGGFNYHYWVYSNVDSATRYLLWTVEKYHEPVFAAVSQGTHWVLVIGYEADNPAWPGSPGTIRRVRYADPLQDHGYSYQWKFYNTGSDQWVNYFKSYTALPDDPDPTTGWYITPPDHWRYHWVTIERDDSTLSADNGMGGLVSTRPLTYLPDIHNGSGWSSQIIIRNNSSSTANVTITYYDDSGQPVNTMISTSINGYGSLTVPPPGSFNGSAVIAATQDIRAVVINDNGSDSAAYEGIPATPSVSGIGTGTSVYIPVNYYNYYGWYTTIYVMNAGTDLATAQAYLYNDNGAQITSSSATLYPNERSTFSFNNLTMGWVRLNANQPLAVVVSHDYTGPQTGKTIEYPGAVSGGTASYITSLFKSYYGWTSSYQNIEVSGNSVSVHVTYSPSGIKDFSLNPFGHLEVYMGSEPLTSPWNGSAKVAVTGGGGRVVTAVHHQNGDLGALGYLGILAGSRNLGMPYMVKATNGWEASLTLQNVGTTSTNVSLYFNNSNGTQIASRGPYYLAAGASRELYTELPSGFTGSVRISSDSANVSAVIHESHTSGQNYGYVAVP